MSKKSDQVHFGLQCEHSQSPCVWTGIGTRKPYYTKIWLKLSEDYLHAYCIYFPFLIPILSTACQCSHYYLQPIRFCHDLCESIVSLLSYFKNNYFPCCCHFSFQCTPMRPTSTSFTSSFIRASCQMAHRNPAPHLIHPALQLGSSLFHHHQHRHSIRRYFCMAYGVTTTTK